MLENLRLWLSGHHLWAMALASWSSKPIQSCGSHFGRMWTHRVWWEWVRMVGHWALGIYLSMKVHAHYRPIGGNTFRKSPTTQQTHVNRPQHPPSHGHQYTFHSGFLSIASQVSAISGLLFFLRSMPCKFLSQKRLSGSLGLQQDQWHPLLLQTPFWTSQSFLSRSHLRCPHHRGLPTMLGPGNGAGVPCFADSSCSTYKCVACEFPHVLESLTQILMLFSSPS